MHRLDKRQKQQKFHSKAKIDEAYSLYRRKQYSEAMAIFREVSSKDPNYRIKAQIGEARCLALISDTINSTQLFESIYKTATRADDKLEINLALCSHIFNLFYMGRISVLDEAKKYLDAIPVQHSRREIHKVAKAWLRYYELTKEKHKALEYIVQFNRKNRIDILTYPVDVRFLLIEHNLIHILRGKNEERDIIRRRLINDALTMAKFSDPNFVYRKCIIDILTDLVYITGDKEKIEPEIIELLNRKPHRTRAIHDSLLLAMAYAKNDAPDKALEIYENLMAEHPQHWKLHLHYANEIDRMDLDPERAKQLLINIIKSHDIIKDEKIRPTPKFVLQAYVLLSFLAWNSNDFQECKRICQQGMEFGDRFNAKEHSELSRFYAQLKSSETKLVTNFNKAVKNYEETRQINASRWQANHGSYETFTLRNDVEVPGYFGEMDEFREDECVESLSATEAVEPVESKQADIKATDEKLKSPAEVDMYSWDELYPEPTATAEKLSNLIPAVAAPVNSDESHPEQHVTENIEAVLVEQSSAEVTIARSPLPSASVTTAVYEKLLNRVQQLLNDFKNKTNLSDDDCKKQNKEIEKIEETRASKCLYDAYLRLFKLEKRFHKKFAYNELSLPEEPKEVVHESITREVASPVVVVPYTPASLPSATVILPKPSISKSYTQFSCSMFAKAAVAVGVTAVAITALGVSMTNRFGQS